MEEYRVISRRNVCPAIWQLDELWTMGLDNCGFVCAVHLGKFTFRKFVVSCLHFFLHLAIPEEPLRNIKRPRMVKSRVMALPLASCFFFRNQFVLFTDKVANLQNDFISPWNGIHSKWKLLEPFPTISWYDPNPWGSDVKSKTKLLSLRRCAISPINSKIYTQLSMHCESAVNQAIKHHQAFLYRLLMKVFLISFQRPTVSKGH